MRRDLQFDLAAAKLLTQKDMPPECLPVVAERTVWLMTMLSDDEKALIIETILELER